MNRSAELTTVPIGLHSKLILTMGVIFGVVLLAILGSTYMAESRSIKQAGMMQAEALNRMAYEALYASMRQGGGRMDNLAVIERLRGERSFNSLRVISSEPLAGESGALTAGLPPDALDRRALDGAAVQQVLAEDGGRVIRFATPLTAEKKCTQCHALAVGQVSGAVSTTISLASLDSTLRQRRNYLLRIVVGSLLLLAAALFFTVQYIVIRPLQRIRRGTAVIADGDLGYRLDVRTGDELESLADGINSMVKQLDATHAEIVKEQSRVLASIQASHDAIWISDAERRIVMINPALERLTGLRKEELLGRNCQYVMGLEMLNGASLCDIYCPFLHPNGDNGAIEGCMPSAAGGDVFVKISYGRITDSDGMLTQVVHIVHDLTERREVEQLKDEFVSMVSHELRTPLHHIKGFATTLLQTDVEWDVETQRDFLGSINDEADRLSLYVNKILHLSRLEAGALPLDRHWHSAIDLVNGALVKPTVSAARDRIRVCMADNLPPLYVDGLEIETVLLNLIENALKYGGADSPITITVEFRHGLIAFCVADEGDGIRAEDREQIFERFARVNNHVQRTSSSGLGLAICRRIVETHGGRIWVESEIGEGSRFCFTLSAYERQPIELII
ncbi:MAG: PAS domain S-box protein [Caldilineaceae bacterium]|nr:PAS domain S-box protein [Caldilineaceae bacterium]